MKYFDIIVAVFILLLCLKAVDNAKTHLQVPAVAHGGEAFNVTCMGSINDFRHTMHPIMELIFRDGCSNDKSYKLKTLNGYHQRMFTITCETGNHTIKCMNNGKHPLVINDKLQVIEKPPKVINKPHNITTDVGLPVTLTCYVEGDPNHYWVGWMSRQTVIQAGEEHSISTSPNFKSTNGTIHHLTIHSVKETGKYECKVYTLTGNVQDQVSHHIIVNDHDDGQIESSSLWDTLRTYFF